MSLHDQLREVAYGTDEERSEREVVTDAVASLIDSTEDSHALGKGLIVATGANVLIALFAVFKPDLVIDLFGEYLLLLPVLTFGLGFFIAFSLYRMYEQAFRAGGAKQAPIDRGLMSGYSGYDMRSRHYVIWFAGAAGAILNVILMLALALLL